VDAWNEKLTERSSLIGFLSGNQKALIDNRYKLYQNSETLELYDLLSDPYEEQDISSKHPETLNEMKGILEGFVSSCQKSTEGDDY